MRQFITGLVGLVGLVAAQSSSQSDASVSSNTVSSSSTSVAASTSNSASSAGSTSSFAVSSTATSSSAVSSSISSTSSSASVPSAASNANAITVALDGSAQYTAINQAVAAAQNSAIPSVVVQPGVYSETVLIQGTQAVTIVGPTASSYAGNQVVISAAAPTGVVSFNTQRSNGIVLRNINITNTISTATAKAPAFNAYGMNMLIDTCALVSGGVAVYQANLGTTLIANSYIEGPDKLFYAYVTAYVYNSVIVPTAPSASIGYLQGYQTGGVWYNSSLIVDSSSIQQKPGSSASYVYLAQPNQNATVAVYRGTNMGNLIAPNAVRSTACATLYTLYGEFANTGPGAMSASNQASRTSSCDQALTANQMPSFSVDQVFGRAFPGFSSYDTTWIPSGLLSAIKSSDAAQVASNPSTPVSSSSSASSSLSASSVISSSSGSSSASATSGSVSSSGSSSLLSSSTVDATNSTSSSVSVSGTGVTSTSSASATLSSSSSASLASSTTNSTAMSVVTVAPTSAQFSDVNAAVAYAQNSGIATVSVLAGLYSGVTILGTQTVTIAGPTATAVSDNQVVITSGSSAGSVSLGTNNGRGLTLRNLNLTNSAASAGLGPAVSARGINVGIYTCALISSAQGVFTSSYGVTVIANSYLQGTDKIFYNYPTVYVYGSTISPTLSGSSIFYGKGATIAGTNYNATLVVDSSSVQGSGSNVYLGTPNGAAGMINLVYRNTALGSLIAPGGVYSSACSAPGSMFGEFQNNGPGAYANNAAARGAASCDFQLSADQVSSYSIKNIFANAFSGYASTDLSWVDSSVLSAIQSSDDAQLSSATISSATVTPSANATSSGINTASTTCPTPTPSATLVVSLNGTACSYGNISAAISALPNDNQPYTIQIQPGTYQEQISITRNGKVTLVGQSSNPSDYSQNTVKVQFANGQLTSAGKDEQTPTLNVKKVGSIPDFAVYNIDFINTYPQTPNTAALAADYYGSNFAAYGCSFIGFQDTLLTNKGVQVFANSYIEGSIDYIWGFATTYFYRSVIASNTVGGFVNAQARVAGTVSGNVFDQCKITYKQSTYGSTFGMTYLGRPYSSYSTVVYKNSWIDKHINPAGWTIWSTGSPQTSNVIFGEYNNTGPGSWQVGSPRATFATNMTADQVAPYSLSSWIGDTSFIDQTAWNFPAPFTIDANTTTPTTPTGTTGATATASINAHPDSGTVPPQFAVTVSVNGEMNGSYSNITAALASLPNDNTNQTVFIYPGSYNEQLPSINRPGAVRLIGSTDGNPGQSYKDNKVTITFSRGLSVSPLPTGHNDAETAVVSTASSRISFYNINIVNTDNLDGSQTSYVTLAASIYGQDIGFYACSFNGWQDTLLNGATAGYQYYESCYIGGAIDFIWGYSKAYFKGCTIGAKRASSAMTAQSRASSSAIGGYIFDQCLFTAAPDATVDLTNKVFLGRPYSAYALVVVKNSYIDKQVSPSGWKVWSATDPRTGFITFAEYNNTGPSNWENNVAARQAFQYATLLTSDTYSLQSTMDNTEWIDMTYWNSISTPQPAFVVPVPGNTTVTGNSAYNGTTPPQGALIVSQTPIDGQTVYPTIQQALDAAPTSSKTNATIFIYPGTYNEKLIVNKSGTTIFMGYSDNTGDYNSNKVTIQQSFGVDTQGTGSDVDAATVYAKGNYFYAYNINFRNNNGTQQDIASLGFAVQSSKFAFMHGCQIYGNQDTLYISGSMFTFKSLIIGNIDFIFGSGSGYFLNSTIAPNEDGDSITAAKRATASTAAGFVFDQCSVVPAPGVNAAGWKNVSLGRPWNNFANVAYIGSYLDGMIGAAGWDQWSKSSPQTDGVSYGEYHNYGPGSSTCGRVSFSKQLSDTDVVPYQLHNFFLSTSWIDFSVVDVQPFSVGQGTAPACATATASSSTVSSTSSSSISSSSISLVTVYTTQTYTDKEIATISVTSPVTSTTTQVIAGTDGPTNTPSPMFKTSVVKATSVVTSTVTAPDSTITLKSTQTVVSTQTAQGKAVTTTVTAISYATSTVVPKVVTVKSTTTVFTLSTITPKPKTVTDTQGELQTSYVTITPKAATVSSTISLSGALVVKTQQAKAHTVTSLITSTQTSTKKTTVTCAPTPAARFFRRGLEARAAGTTTLTINATVTSFTKTSFVTLPGSTIFATVTSTSSGRPATTLKPATSTVLSTSFANSVALVTQPGNTATITDIATKTSNTVYTQPASTVTQTVQSTSLSVITEAGTTTTSYKIVSSTSYTTLPVPTSTVVVNANSVTTLKTTLPASTTTVFKTVSGKATTSYVTAQPADVTKTATVKSVSTVYSTVTKSKAGATACA